MEFVKDDEAIYQRKNAEAPLGLTMAECRGIQSNMKQQTDVLGKLFKALEKGKEHPELLDGISDDDIKFAEKYCQDMIYACATFITLARNAEEILKPMEEAKKEAEKAEREEEKKAEKAKPKKRRAPRKKKAPVKIAQTETESDIVEEVVDEEGAGDGED